MTTDYVVPGLTARVELRQRQQRNERRRRYLRNAAARRYVAGLGLCLIAVGLALGAQIAVLFID